MEKIASKLIVANIAAQAIDSADAGLTTPTITAHPSFSMMVSALESDAKQPTSNTILVKAIKKIHAKYSLFAILR